MKAPGPWRRVRTEEPRGPVDGPAASRVQSATLCCAGESRMLKPLLFPKQLFLSEGLRFVRPTLRPDGLGLRVTGWSQAARV